jgi:pyridoxine kinase
VSAAPPSIEPSKKENTNPKETDQPTNQLTTTPLAARGPPGTADTGYPSFAGAALTAAQLAALLDGLAANGLLAGRYTHLLTGYVPGPLAGAVAAAAARLAAANPGLVYVCDPVMGDEGRLYCAPELPGRYRAEIVPLAAVLTPNQFEAELLTGRRIGDVAGAAAACAALHAMGPPTVVLTSLALPDAPGELR